MNALEIKNLSKTYVAKKTKEVKALVSLDLVVAKGEVFGFLGPNGAGKSTTIKAIMGLIKPSNGEAFVEGINIKDPSSRRNIGYLPENPCFFEFLTAREYLVFIGKSFKMPDDAIAARVAEILDRLELTSAANRPIRGYSKGMVQRLGLAQAILHDPDLFILDEPMSGLDPLGRVLVKELIMDMKRQGKTVFFSTHITADVEAVCDRVGIIVKGELRALESVENILEKGIEGYKVKISTSNGTTLFEGFSFERINERKVEYYVPRVQFRQFMKAVVETECEVEFIEPVRKDIEQFFLAIVENR